MASNANRLTGTTRSKRYFLFWGRGELDHDPRTIEPGVNVVYRQEGEGILKQNHANVEPKLPKGNRQRTEPFRRDGLCGAVWT